jgi:hypothetical protein
MWKRKANEEDEEEKKHQEKGCPSPPRPPFFFCSLSFPLFFFPSAPNKLPKQIAPIFPSKPREAGPSLFFFPLAKRKKKEKKEKKSNDKLIGATLTHTHSHTHILVILGKFLGLQGCEYSKILSLVISEVF